MVISASGVDSSLSSLRHAIGEFTRRADGCRAVARRPHDAAHDKLDLDERRGRAALRAHGQAVYSRRQVRHPQARRLLDVAVENSEIYPCATTISITQLSPLRSRDMYT